MLGLVGKLETDNFYRPYLNSLHIHRYRSKKNPRIVKQVNVVLKPIVHCMSFIIVSVLNIDQVLLVCVELDILNTVI